ncbi:MAG: nickel-dependent lactate racemase [Desulfotignum sp.]|nr:nickel-dependent lactate racemase [Desulfotignum sp.]
MKIDLEKGRTHVTVDLPDTNLLSVIQGKEVPPLSMDQAAVVLQKGIQDTAPPGIAFQKVAVIIPDDTRLWARGDLFVPAIIQALADLGVPDKQITVIIALGTHAPIPDTRFAHLAGQASVSRVRICNSAGLDPSRLVNIGKTSRGTCLSVTKEAVEADHIIIFGGLLHHLIAGFGGGRKYILPGIAGYDSIQQNHSLAFDGTGRPHPLVRQAVTQGNPVHEDMMEGADLFLQDKTACYAAVASNGAGEIFYAAAGDLHPTFDRGCTALNTACCVTVPEKGDFALVSAGGFRTDGQLYQATKALFNIVGVVKDGGSILFVAGCDQGVGNPDFAKALQAYRTCPEELGKALTRSFHMPSYVAFRLMELLNRFDVSLVSDLPETLVRDSGFTPVTDIQAWTASLTGNGYVIPFGENILPRVSPTATPRSSFRSGHHG